jgi:hypothetical protein
MIESVVITYEDPKFHVAGLVAKVGTEGSKRMSMVFESEAEAAEYLEEMGVQNVVDVLHNAKESGKISAEYRTKP